MRAERREETARAVREQLLHAEAEIEVPAGLWERVRTSRDDITVAPVPPARRRPGPLGVIAVAAVAVAAVVSGTWWLVSPTSGPAPGESAAPGDRNGGAVTLRVYNVEEPCRELRTLECSLRVARDPYTLYADPDNAAGRVWHGDRLTTTCVVTDGRTVTDEKGLSSPRWYRVERAEGGTDHGRVAGWLPGVRTRNTTEVPTCSAAEKPSRNGS